MTLNVLSLFAGIGGLELSLERAGMTVVGQVEIDPFCRRVLENHWPDVPKHDDVRTAVQWWESEPRPDVELICGGFPCQPFSHAGQHLGVADERWGWPWMRDVIDAVRPSYVVVENVPPLLRDVEAFSAVLSDLSDLRFDADWDVVSACSLGAPHTRRRLFLVAYPDGGDGISRMGSVGQRSQPVSSDDSGSGAWRDRVDWALQTASRDDRNADGLSVQMVQSLGNAVVTQVSEYIGTQLLQTIGAEA
ncbi:DNA cytosine methyltransferase [Mycobacterium intracellulare]|uniref:DNA cytosine methyltransferase n=1 Tax=Mycobacterium intracellulare TaxID=1767 RepID=UPI00109EB771|nr:DNA (cytosine-5-)-methyltransferase [Mycobacterium intracellulare]